MPYELVSGELYPRDKNVPNPIEYHSIMGVHNITGSVYPPLSCPVNNCEEEQDA